jgi:16S rRNA (guanine966-N2)-methyltransferase
MRIIAGVWRGRNLASPAGAATRPTAERLRESVFNMLMHAPWAERLLSGASVLDGFAGTGALGLEALSRGAASCVFVEQDRAALMALRANIIACRADSQARVLAQDALKLGRGAPCHLVFLDPPYDFPHYDSALQSALACLKSSGFVYLESAKAWPADTLLAAGWHLHRHLKAGAVHAHLLQAAA